MNMNSLSEKLINPSEVYGDLIDVDLHLDFTEVPTKEICNM